MAGRTFDICEYLMKMKREGQLATDFLTQPRSRGLPDSLPSCAIRTSASNRKS